MRTKAIPKARLAFFLQHAADVTPPPMVATLGDDVLIDLELGAQQLMVSGGGAAAGFPYTFSRASDAGSAIHRFIGSALSPNPEISRGLSSQFSTMIALSFMYEVAGVCWSAFLDPPWDKALETSAGPVTVRKRQRRADGPDYLVATFDPHEYDGGEFFALEIKGRAAETKFGSKVFDGWKKQALNIRLSDSAGEQIAIKPWVVAFNYGFTDPPAGSAAQSALLVDDPWTPGRRDVDRRGLWDWLVRHHLARQCTFFREPELAGAVVAGRQPQRRPATLYKVAHEAVSRRRYIGDWYERLPDGSFRPSREPLIVRMRRSSPPSKSADELEVDFYATGFFGHGWLHFRGDFSPSLLEAALGKDHVFVGQDANMLRECVRTRVGQPLRGPFSRAVEVDQAPEPETPGISILSNGSVIADADAVFAAPDEGFWDALDQLE